VRRIGRELLEKGTYSSVFEEAIPFAEVNALLARSASANKEKRSPLMPALRAAKSCRRELHMHEISELLRVLNDEIVACRKCPRLVEYRQRVASKSV